MIPWIRDATHDDVLQVSLAMQDRDYDEISCQRFERTREELAKGLADQYGNFPFVFSIGLERPIVVMMGICACPNVWSIGMWSTPELPRIKKFVTKFASQDFFGAMRLSGAHRVECKSIVGYDSVHNWLRFLGFRQSPDVIEKMGRNGEDFLSFEWIEGMPWPRGYVPTAE